ncbi:MAG: OsmC family peroxiredoxin [Bacteroidetes bacterium]|nr:MAG: OsmC family peroxiredoxin [Bacteroidota bacterium]
MPLKNNKPVIFSTELSWLADKSGVVSLNSGKKSFRVSTPPEFGGPEGDWSPEHLFLSSIISCFMSTYLVFVNKLKIENTGFECTATGQVEIIDGKYKFTFIHIYPKAFVANEPDIEKARIAMEKSKKYCLISNSINAEIVLHPEVVISKQHAAVNTAA